MAITTLADSEIRSDGFTSSQKSLVIAEFTKVQHLGIALRIAGVSRRSFYNHLDSDPEFREAFEAAKENIAWDQHAPLLAQSKKGNIGASIWIQKVFGGPMFNPDRVGVQVNIGLGFQLRDTTTSSQPSTEKG